MGTSGTKSSSCAAGSASSTLESRASSTLNSKSSQPPQDVASRTVDKPAPQAAPAASSRIPTLPRAADGWRLPSHYELKRSIGKGSYGSVSECYNSKLKKTLAVKQLRGLFDDLIDCKRILRELAILVKLNNNCVVRVFDIVVPEAIETFNEIYIVLEMCDSDMKKLIRTDVMLTHVHINTLLYNLLVGLKYIHSAGVYHRDLKPANCLVNQDCSVKICDFGLARAVGPNAEQTAQDAEEAFDPTDEEAVAMNMTVVPSTLKKKRNMTQHVVTRWYRAPELILLQHGYTEAIDIWSIGCIFAELLQMQEESIRFSDRGPLFPGCSCFPLSPERRKAGGQKKRGKNDQLEMIFSVIGTPSEEECAVLENEEARKYVNSFPTSGGDGVGSNFPSVGAEAKDLLKQMLRFSPKQRLKVEEALAHPLLFSLRDASSETTAPSILDLGFNDDGDLPEAELRVRFGDELDKFKQQAAAAGWVA